ncbi:MAG: tetratricopeptide repeat protein, partial [Hyphomicrobiaceae bacterium]
VFCPAVEALADDSTDCFAADTESKRRIAACTWVIKNDPKNAEGAYVNRGVAYAAENDAGRAIDDYVAALAINPRDAAAFHNSGNLWAHEGQYDRAITMYSRAIEIDHDPKTYRLRANAYYEIKAYGKAIADYTAIIRANPKDANAYYNRGRVHKAKRDFDRAIADYSRAIEIVPRMSPFYAFRGDVYAEKGDKDRAIQEYRKALNISRTDIFALEGLKRLGVQP